MLACSFFSALVALISAIEIPTGDGYLFYVKQRIVADNIIMTDSTSAYYQYYESVNKTSNKNLLVYFGNYLTRSAVREAAFGFTPYFYIPDAGSKDGVKVVWNPWSVNRYANLLVVDIVRGTGFGNTSDTSELTFTNIAADMESFIKKFFEIYPQTESYNKHLYLYAGYHMVQPTLIFLNNTNWPFKALFGSSWTGYSSIDQLHVTIPSFGYTDRMQLDRISNQIYGLQVNDYSKDIDDMYSDLASIINLLENNGFMDFNNPTLSQDQVYTISQGFQTFYAKCMPCRAYVKVYKDSWADNDSILQGMKRSLIMDSRSLLLYTYKFIRSKEQLKKVEKDFVLLESGNSLKTNIQSLEDASTYNFVQDNSLIYAYIKMSKYSLRVTDSVKVYIEECPACGFYPFMEETAGATAMMSFYSLIYNTTEPKNVENEYNAIRAMMASSAKLF